ncbi:helix-turn-helix domain-containing protein [Adlercreutzia mucosicola]|uniref:helix-turn-helix domain-containing protein n=1 Tax=Adlercreutzia mucosicola TaxID=580026 RepID=UPI0003F8A9E3|nr:helix-turn-helix domain-containing protein [Adlercreutzia mucosicola]MCR2034402.1 helix-turn-helix domain-containing protein [Adlercreutzia mucosicola]
MFYENFERICKSAGVSPSAAGLAIGVSKSTPSAWKKNGTIPKEDELKALAQHLHCSVADFFADDSGMRFGTSEESAINALYQAQDDEALDLDENEEELLRIYGECSKKQRAKLMMLVYDFEEEELA